jgi:hypothetical protein
MRVQQMFACIMIAAMLLRVLSARYRYSLGCHLDRRNALFLLVLFRIYTLFALSSSDVSMRN